MSYSQHNNMHFKKIPAFVLDKNSVKLYRTPVLNENEHLFDNCYRLCQSVNCTGFSVLSRTNGGKTTPNCYITRDKNVDHNKAIKLFDGVNVYKYDTYIRK